MSSTPTDLDTEFEALVRRNRTGLERLARQLAGNREDAEDLLQESLLDAYRSFHCFRPGSHFYGWVGRITRNNHLDRVRRKRWPTIPLDAAAPSGGEALELPDERADPEQILLEEQLDHPFHTALEALQPAHRDTVVLCDLEGATYEEAAKAASCPVGTIRSRLHRAHKALREFIGTVVPAFREEPEPPARLQSRRAFLRMSTAAVAGAALHGLGSESEAQADRGPLRVRVVAPPAAGEEARALVEALRAPHMDAAEISPEELRSRQLAETDVLVFWGEPAKPLSAEAARAIARRVRHEGMGLIVAGPGTESPVLEALLGTPRLWERPAGPPSGLEVRVTAPRHPIARGLGTFRIERAPECGGFAGPQPGIVVFDGLYDSSGARAWQGMVWTAGRGRLFYFAPGTTSELSTEVLQLLNNAVEWCGGQ